MNHLYPQTTSQSPPRQADMVSHAEVVDRSRRAPSVSSRTSRSKHHHRGRSHQGGSSYAPQNEFPFFTHTGDVEVIVSADGFEKRYLLHRLILAQCSGFFEAGTSEEWSRAQAIQDLQGHDAGARPDQALTVIGEESESVAATPVITPAQITRGPPGRRRWRYELDWENASDDEEPMLVQKTPNPGSLFTSDFHSPIPPPQPRSKPPPARSSFFHSMANLTLGSHHSQSTTHLPTAQTPVDPIQASPVIRDYDNLFRIFYNYPPTLDSTNIASAYSECKSLLCLADMYDALPVVGSRVDHHLLRFSSRLFKQIAKYPPSYLKLGYLARSRIIFSEALTHVVGQWPQPYPYLKETGYEVPDSVIDLIEDKVDDLEELKSRVEAKLFRLTLTTNRGERVNPANDYLGWLAMSLFRQWVAENTTPPPQSILKTTHSPQQQQQLQQQQQHHPHPHPHPPPPPPPGIPNQFPAPPPPHRPHHAPPAPPPPQSHPPPPAPLPSGRIYRLLGSTNPQAYLPHDELKRFLKLHPSDSSGLYSRDNLRRFERKVDEMKNLARDVVKPLIRCCLELDVSLRNEGVGAGAGAGTGTGGLPYLVCMRVEEGELPWD